jgi:O-antigen ligase
LPGHAAAAEAALQAGLAPEWRSISLAPVETMQSMLALAPPAAVFLGASLVTDIERRRLCLLVPAAAMVSLLIGAMQIAGGEASPLYFYEVTNRGWAVGLFSNRNHQAILLIMSLPFAALWLCNADATRRSAMLTAAVVTAAYIALVVIGLVIVGSRAGVLLLAPALVMTAAMLIRADRYGGKRGLIAGAVLLAMVAAMATLVMGPLVERFTAARGEQRLDTAPVVASAGLGSFPQVYAGVEPVDIMAETFFNHAHNDYLEIWLEAGILGVAALLAFIGWWLNRSFLVWTLPTTPGRNLSRAASAAITLLLIHSLVEYPSRALAIASVLALSCALLARRSADFDGHGGS